MGYTFTIGQAKMVWHEPGQYYTEPYITIEAEHESHPDAPAHDKYVDNGNSRSPSYSGWEETCKQAGIYELFYGMGWDRERRCYKSPSRDFHRDDSLLAEHPGFGALYEADVKYLSDAVANYKAAHPNAVPGFQDEPGVDNGKDATLARLLWLHFWVDHAVKNHENPIIKNT